ncbi:hypothetical protein QSJ18_04365 [Gordonia sp. ABSL1-1]|uniref:hypothetical protein n=1 Tax=Gordonia sp. ABSL1-1 TaxID=3053923 RepID=UPI002572C806|nr:hypothetical protein [Gordonia sp. ABSL1-1]MDL9935972.1 hypothetical protein [Gordonia sp. ABSL1-1]
MKFTKLIAAATTVVASMGIAAGVAHADPAPQSAATHWNVARHGGSVVVTTDNGSFTQERGRLVLHDAKGAVVDAVPLTVAVDDFTHPVNAQVSGTSARLKLDTNPVLARFQPVAHKADLSAAVSGVKDNITLTAAIGGFVGAAAGLVGGCLLGAVAAGVVSAPAVMLFGAGPLAGCVGGALLLGSGASLAGTAIGGLGAVAANIGPFIQLLNQPPKKK